VKKKVRGTIPRKNSLSVAMLPEGEIRFKLLETTGCKSWPTGKTNKWWDGKDNFPAIRVPASAVDDPRRFVVTDRKDGVWPSLQ